MRVRRRAFGTTPITGAVGPEPSNPPVVGPLDRQAMLDLTRYGWALDNPAYRQLFTSLYLPDASEEQAD